MLVRRRDAHVFNSCNKVEILLNELQIKIKIPKEKIWLLIIFEEKCLNRMIKHFKQGWLKEE